MKKILFSIIIVFFFFFVLAEIVTAEADYRHTGDISANEGCKISKQRAQLKAIEKVAGQTISSEESEMCSEVEGQSNCERNQFFLSQFNAEITGVKVLEEKKSMKDDYYICKVKIEANVTPHKQINDPNFDFNINFNNYNFRTGDELKIEISLSTPMYLNIFQVLPYENPKNYQAVRLFPNKFEKDGYIKDAKMTLPRNGKYEVYFPKNVNSQSVDEYLVFIASKNKMNFLQKYTAKEDLVRAYLGLRNVVKFKRKAYRIVK